MRYHFYDALRTNMKVSLERTKGFGFLHHPSDELLTRYKNSLLGLSIITP